MTETVEIGDVDRNSGVVIGSSTLSVETMNLLQITGQQTAMRVRARQWFSPHRLTELAACFVEPAGFAQALAVLGSKQSVLLAGPAGTGRTTAAAMLLHRIGGAGRIRQLDVNLSDDEQPVLDVEQVRREESLLLDLSTMDMPDFLRVAAELGPLLSRATEVGSRLAVVLPDYERQVPEAVPRGLRVELMLTPQLAQQVFEHHLRVHGVAAGAANPALAAMFATPRAGELAELADLIARSEAMAWSEALATALDELSNRSAELTEMFAKHPDAAWRSLLVAVALVDGGPADAAFEADRELLRLLEFPDSEEHPLARSGLTARLADVGAEIADGRVRFTLPRYGDAVLTYVWRNFPGLRPKLAGWVQRVPRLPRTGMADGDRAAVAERFLDLSLRHGGVNDVLATVRDWATGDSRTTALAVQTLGAAVVDSRYGWRVRGRVYDWARDPGLPPRLAGVLITVCENVLWPVYPSVAMVRLHLLTAHRDDTVGHAAIDALLRLADDPQTRNLVLERVAAQLYDGDPGRDVELLGRLVDPGQPLPNRDLVTVAWHGALIRPEVEPLVRAWLAVGTEDVLDVLVDACDGGIERLARLRGMAAAWAREEPAGRRRVGLMLDTRIDSAMDLARTAPGREG
ncbi:hypothetical protein [Kutzneria sp. CA-103260]|uniref:hypothetical protein n=1 Tax=Kutzneria sp. CA-103260 TaxID=2802641 RepID=UPI001BAD614D|nr:hypothetical protein [Kutzneria sp. CA-103260]QUQ71490.1 hypothetical protein JJ691_92770 [Kutzneria sp. CA-103260]